MEIDDSTKNKEMNMIYKIMIGKKLENYLYFNEDDAIWNARRISRDITQVVKLWEAEEIEGVPVDELVWRLNRVFMA